MTQTHRCWRPRYVLPLTIRGLASMLLLPGCGPPLTAPLGGWDLWRAQVRVMALKDELLELEQEAVEVISELCQVDQGGVAGGMAPHVRASTVQVVCDGCVHTSPCATSKTVCAVCCWPPPYFRSLTVTTPRLRTPTRRTTMRTSPRCCLTLSDEHTHWLKSGPWQGCNGRFPAAPCLPHPTHLSPHTPPQVRDLQNNFFAALTQAAMAMYEKYNQVPGWAAMPALAPGP